MHNVSHTRYQTRYQSSLKKLAAGMLSCGADVFVAWAGFVEALWLLMTRSFHLFLAIVEVLICTVISISGVIAGVLKAFGSVIIEGLCILMTRSFHLFFCNC